MGGGGSLTNVKTEMMMMIELTKAVCIVVVKLTYSSN